MGWDETLLVWINQGWAHPGLDWLFRWVSQRQTFSYPLYGVVLFWLWRAYGKAGLKLGLLLALAVGLGDALGNLLKHLTDQYRPCFDFFTQLRLPPGARWPCGEATTGMPSNHALNFFTAAVFIGVTTRARLAAGALLLVAVLVGLSRIYLGKHYPSQVLAGAGLGSLLGLLLGGLAVRYLGFVKGLRPSRAAGRNTNHE